MRFSELLKLPYDKNTQRIHPEKIAAALPDTPADVIQVYSDHGRNHDFQLQYAGLNLAEMAWRHVPMLASEIISCSCFPKFLQWVENVSRRVDRYQDIGWPCLDARDQVVSYWRSNNTWLQPPVFIDAALISDRSGIHLMEGHTRVGSLIGLVRHRVLSETSTHPVWIGGRGTGESEIS